ncbi:hypothetical protein ACFUJ0_06520 [Streptomyces sp. NPDC057242]|uniref:hypothetical protein n=1 Tax=Streptomyces sp. NPDC057242 TaxID=3346063 RepID=UPI0036395E4C
MTSRRTLGTGPQIQGHEADLLATLPNVPCPTSTSYPPEAVLGIQPTSKPAERRALGTGRQAQHHQDEAQT